MTRLVCHALYENNSDTKYHNKRLRASSYPFESIERRSSQDAATKKSCQLLTTTRERLSQIIFFERSREPFKVNQEKDVEASSILPYAAIDKPNQ